MQAASPSPVAARLIESSVNEALNLTCGCRPTSNFLFQTKFVDFLRSQPNATSPKLLVHPACLVEIYLNACGLGDAGTRLRVRIEAHVRREIDAAIAEALPARPLVTVFALNCPAVLHPGAMMRTPRPGEADVFPRLWCASRFIKIYVQVKTAEPVARNALQGWYCTAPRLDRGASPPRPTRLVFFGDPSVGVRRRATIARAKLTPGFQLVECARRSCKPGAHGSENTKANAGSTLL